MEEAPSDAMPAGSQPSGGGSSTRTWFFWAAVAVLALGLVAAFVLTGRSTQDDDDLQAQVESAEAEIDHLIAQIDALTAEQADAQSRLDTYRALRTPNGVQAVAALNDLVAQDVCGASGPVDPDQIVRRSAEALIPLFPVLAEVDDAAILIHAEALSTDQCDEPPPSTEPPATTAPAPTTTTAPPTTQPPDTAPPPTLTPGAPCTLGTDPDCIDPYGDGTGTYLIGGADCIATFPDSPGLCSDLDGDGHAGYPDSG